MGKLGNVPYENYACPTCGTPCTAYLDEQGGRHLRPWAEEENHRLKQKIETQREQIRALLDKVENVKGNLRAMKQHYINSKEHCAMLEAELSVERGLRGQR